MIERLLRAAAVAIAVAALIDPPLALMARSHPRLAVTVLQPADATAARVRERLARDLRADFDVVRGPDPDAAAAVVIGDRYPARPSAFAQTTSTVTMDGSGPGLGVRITSVKAPRAVPRGTTIQLEVDLDGSAANGSMSVVTVSAGAVGHPDVDVARASHTWTAANRRVSLRLDAVPLDLPPWHLRVRLSAGTQATAATSDVLVEEAAPLRVLFYEPRPSWIATFVRRALERDPRFAASGLGYASRGIRISSGDEASLDPPTLRQVAAVIVGGLDRLSVADRDLLDRFARARGGSLVLLPDAPIRSGPARDWLPANPRQVLLERAVPLSVTAPLPAIQAAEILTFSGARVLGATVPGATVPGAKVLARVSGSGDPVVTVTPHGAGRLLVSGALDAWRYRAENDAAFDRFWRSAIAGMALATPPPVNVEITPAVIPPGETARVVVRIHRSALAAAPAGPLGVSARLDTGEPIRLWPEPGADVFSGSFVAGGPAVQRVAVSAGEDEATSVSGSALAAIDPAARRAEPIAPPLAMLAASRGGIDVTPEHLSDLEAHLRREVSAPPVRSTTHPMRSGWWILPLAGCLGGEWWLRRRRGLR
jgi:hypothetical protein